MTFDTRYRDMPAQTPEWERTRASVIVVNYNGGQIVLDCLASILQWLGSSDEVIVVDNASTDGSRDQIRSSFPELKLVASPVNTGFAEANNQAASIAAGEYLVFVNPDTLVESDWITPLVDWLRADSSTGIATSRVLMMTDKDTVNTCGNDVHVTGITLCRGIGLPSHLMSSGGVVSAASGAAMAMRRDLFHRIGGFDGSFFLYMEDADLSLRVRLAGYQVRYVPESTVLHDYRLRFGKNKVFFQERNRYIMLLKALQLRTLIVMAPTLVLAELITWAFVVKNRPSQALEKVRAYVWILDNATSILRARRHVQSFRRISDRDLIRGCTSHLEYGQVEQSAFTRIADRVLNPVFASLVRLSLPLTR